MKFVVTLAVSFALLPITASAVSGYICVAKESTGFSKSDGDWSSTTFKANTRYNISRAQSDDENPLQGNVKAVWVVKELGNSNVSFWCMNDFTSAGTLRCEGFGGEFWFNNKRLRFQDYYAIGYVNDSNSDTPSLTIGTCSSY